MCDCYDRFGRCVCYDPPAVDSRLARLALSLQREVDAIHDECVVLQRAGQDYTALWARSAGVFLALRQIKEILGWQ